MQQAKNKREEKAQKSKKFVCGVKPEDILKDQSQGQPKFPKKKHKAENASKLIQQSKEDMEKQQQECQDDMDATNFTNEQLSEQKQKLHHYMDKHLDLIADQLKTHLEHKNTEKYIKMFSAAIEHATA